MVRIWMKNVSLVRCFLWWDPPCLVCLGEGGQSWAWQVGELFSWLIFVSGAPDLSPLPVLPHLALLVRVLFNSQKEWAYLGCLLFLQVVSWETPSLKLLLLLGGVVLRCPAALWTSGSRVPSQFILLLTSFRYFLWLPLVLFSGFIVLLCRDRKK